MVCSECGQEKEGEFYSYVGEDGEVPDGQNICEDCDASRDDSASKIPMNPRPCTTHPDGHDWYAWVDFDGLFARGGSMKCRNCGWTSMSLSMRYGP